MTVKAGKCVKTGASVLIEDYGRVVSADVFDAGDHVVINMSRGDFYEISEPAGEANFTHRATIAMGFFEMGKNVAVVPHRHFREVIRE